MSCSRHVSYTDCILGKIGAPADPKQKAVFQTMMVTCMVTIMVTFNWVVRTDDLSLDEYVASLYQYPLSFAIALSVRFLIANPTLEKVVKRFIAPRFEGAKRVILITGLNVLYSGTIASFLALLISNGGLAGVTPEFFFLNLAVSCSASFVFSYFLVGPAVKKLFEERVRSHIHTVRKSRAIYKLI